MAQPLKCIDCGELFKGLEQKLITMAGKMLEDANPEWIMVKNLKIGANAFISVTLSGMFTPQDAVEDFPEGFKRREGNQESEKG